MRSMLEKYFFFAFCMDRHTGSLHTIERKKMCSRKLCAVLKRRARIACKVIIETRQVVTSIYVRVLSKRE